MTFNKVGPGSNPGTLSREMIPENFVFTGFSGSYIIYRYIGNMRMWRNWQTR